MKKYFLLIALVTVVFLGLGNYSFACDANKISTYMDCVAANDGALGSCITPSASDVANCTQADCPQSCGIFDSSTSECFLDCITVQPTNILSCDTPSLLNTLQVRNCNCFQSVDGNGTINNNNVGDIRLKNSACCTTITGSVGSMTTCTSQDLDVGEGCMPAKANAHVNGIGSCVCNDGYKNVDGVCTSCKAQGVCCGISLNTSIPFIGNCIEDETASVGPDETGVTGDIAFPILMGSLTKILVTVILIISFVLIIIGGIMIATGNPSGGKKMIIKVVVGIALLGASGVILRLINPNFFG